MTASGAEERFIEELKHPGGDLPAQAGGGENARLRDALQQAVSVTNPLARPLAISPAPPRWGRSIQPITPRRIRHNARISSRFGCSVTAERMTYLLLPGDGGLLGGTTPTPPTSLGLTVTMSLPPPPIQVSKPGPPLSMSLPGPPRERSLPIPPRAKSFVCTSPDHIVTRLCADDVITSLGADHISSRSTDEDVSTCGAFDGGMVPVAVGIPPPPQPLPPVAWDELAELHERVEPAPASVIEAEHSCTTSPAITIRPGEHLHSRADRRRE